MSKTVYADPDGTLGFISGDGMTPVWPPAAAADMQDRTEEPAAECAAEPVAEPAC